MAEFSFLPGADAFPQAKEAALQAIMLDPQLPETQAALGLVQSIGEWDYHNAEKSLRRAVEIGPSYVYARQWLAAVLLKTGRYDEAIGEAETAVRLDPLAAAVLANVGWMNYYSRRFDRALDIADRLGKEHRQFAQACLLRADSLTGMGAIDQASEALAGCSADIRETAVYLRSLGVVHALAGRKSEAVAILNRLLAHSSEQPVGDSYLAAIYARLEQPNEAFYWLDQGITHRDPYTALVNIQPFFDPLRSDPRYPGILNRIGLPTKNMR
jgi:tetratricopeptide (TPR) repeat protein